MKLHVKKYFRISCLLHTYIYCSVARADQSPSLFTVYLLPICGSFTAYLLPIGDFSQAQDWRITVGIRIQPCSACSGAKNNWQCKLTAVIRRQPCSEAVAAHCGDQTTAMLCSSGSKAQTTAMLCSSGSKALTLVSPMQAMLCSNGCSKLTLFGV